MRKKQATFEVQNFHLKLRMMVKTRDIQGRNFRPWFNDKAIITGDNLSPVVRIKRTTKEILVNEVEQKIGGYNL